MRGASRVAVGLLGLSYPLLVYVGLTRLGIREVALALVLLAAARLAFSVRADSWQGRRPAIVPLALAGAVAGLGALLDDERVFLFVPFLVNAALLFGFARTLWRGPPIVETFANLQVDGLSPAEVSYCRTVTRAWCGFFAVNGSAALVFALFGSLESWAVYNGFAAYLLIAAFFTVEFVYRTWRFRRYQDGFTDPLFRRIFPPRELS